MKIKTLAIVVLSALSLSSTAALADTTTVNGGTVHFKGEIVNAACAVDAGSIDQTVQLGQVRSAKLAAEGNTSSAVGFNIYGRADGFLGVSIRGASGRETTHQFTVAQRSKKNRDQRKGIRRRDVTVSEA